MVMLNDIFEFIYRIIVLVFAFLFVILDYLFKLLGYKFVLGIIILVILVGIAVIVLNIIRSKRSGDYAKVKSSLIAVLCIIIAAVLWIIGLKWLDELVPSVVMMPFVHAIVFFFVNNFAAPYIKKSNTLKIFAILSYVLYITGYIFLPVLNVMNYVAFLALFGSIVILIAQLIISIVINIKERKERKDKE